MAMPKLLIAASVALATLFGAAVKAEPWPPKGYRELKMRTQVAPPLDIAKLFSDDYNLTEIEYSDAFTVGRSKYQVIMLGSETARDNCGPAGCPYAIVMLNAHFRPIAIVWGPFSVQAIAISLDRRTVVAGENEAGVNSLEYIRLHD